MQKHPVSTPRPSDRRAQRRTAALISQYISDLSQRRVIRRAALAER